MSYPIFGNRSNFSLCRRITELAQVMGVTQHTVQVCWCAEGRIDCEKDPTTGHWRIPGSEYERLRRGGKPDAR